MARAQATAQSIPPASGPAGLARALVQRGQLEESDAESLPHAAHRAGVSFAVALMASLRQDPDVVMVEEIRDLETAEIAIKAQTGHLVLASLHSNDAPATPSRLMNMGIAPSNIASSVNLITVQRLAHRLCFCKRPADIPVEAPLEAGFTEEDLDGGWQPYAPTGCELCSGQGDKGRVGTYQVMRVTEDMRRIIVAGRQRDRHRGASAGRRGARPSAGGFAQGAPGHHLVARGHGVHQRMTPRNLRRCS